MRTVATIKEAARLLPTPKVIEALELLGDRQLREDENLVRAALRELLEDRHPEVDPLMESWASLEWGEDLGYTAALLAAHERVTA